MGSDKKELFDKVNKVIDTLRPYLQADGGDVVVEDITSDMVVKVKLIGACGNCPFSMQTLKAGIEMTLKREIPIIKEVISI